MFGYIDFGHGAVAGSVIMGACWLWGSIWCDGS